MELKHVVLLVGLIAVATPAQAGQGQQATPAEDQPYLYAVGPGDLLRVAVWREAELTSDARVRLDGKISVPLVGDLQAEGRSLEELTSEIRTRLLRFVETPQVTVTVLEASSARFFVLGEVARSGAFPLTGRTSVIQALAIAGGFREFAKRESIMIIRHRTGQLTAIPFNYREVEAGRELRQNVALQPGDTILVP